MTLLPLLLRELRAEARRPWNYWLRLLAGGAVTTVFGLAMLAGGVSMASNGAALFGLVSQALYYGIWFLVPLLTADCLSREKREGTLGLLFLTPLKAGEIVLAKSAVHLLRAISFLFAALPVITIPLLIGGVSAGAVLSLLASHLRAILLALAAGLLASAFAREWIRAVLLTAIFAVAFFLLYGPPGSVAVIVLFSGAGMSSAPPSGAIAFLLPWFVLATECFLSVLVFVVVLLIAQRRLRSASLDESLSKRKLWWLKTFCQPVIWKERFRASMSRHLDTNPIGWLQQYSWSARLTKWGWCFIVIAVETQLLATTSWNAFRAQQQVLVLMLALGIAFTAAGSFRRERQTGALELILVAPLQVPEIIFGRLKGIWGQFVPAMLIFGSTIWFGEDYATVGRRVDPWLLLPLAISTFFTVPIFGLYFSLKKNNFMAAWTMTCLAAGIASALPFILCYPAAGFSVVWLTGAAPGDESNLLVWTLFSQSWFAFLAFDRLRRDLTERRFALHQTMT